MSKFYLLTVCLLQKRDKKEYKKLSWCWQTRATRLEVSQGHIPYVRYGFILVCYSNLFPKTHRFFQIFDFKNAVTLTTGLGSVKVIGNVIIR